MLLAILMFTTLFMRGTMRTADPLRDSDRGRRRLGPVRVDTEHRCLSALFGNSAPLTKTGTAIAIIILAEVWKTTPFMALLLMAGLSLVPEDLTKAARMDGASAWQRFVRVTLPLMKPAILVALLFRTLDAFRIFDNIYILTAGGNGTYSVSILGYDNLFRALNLGVGSAISMMIFICVAIIAFIYIKFFGASAPGAD